MLKGSSLINNFLNQQPEMLFGNVGDIDYNA